MGFIPLAGARQNDFPVVSRQEQSDRDAQAERLVATEFNQDMPPDARRALEAEYQSRFMTRGAVGFTPITDSKDAGRGFVPLGNQVDRPSTLKTIALENPATGAAEASLNFGSQMIALPAAGIAGIGAAAGKALGLTDKDPADVVGQVGDALTYHPRGETGRQAAGIVAYPFEKLAEAGQWVGDKVFDATGSPVAATIADTAINTLPMVFGAKGKRVGEGAPHADQTPAVRPAPQLSPSDGPVSRATLNAKAAEATGQVAAEDQILGVTRSEKGLSNDRGQTSENGNIQTVSSRVSGLESHEDPVHQSTAEGLEELRRAGNHDLSPVDGQFPAVPGGSRAEALTGIDVGAEGQQSGLHAGELPLGNPTRAELEHTQESLPGVGWDIADFDGGGSDYRQSDSWEPSEAGSGPEHGPDAGALAQSQRAADHLPGANADGQGVGGGVGHSEIGAQSSDQVRSPAGVRADGQGPENGKAAAEDVAKIGPSADPQRQDPVFGRMVTGTGGEGVHAEHAAPEGNPLGSGIQQRGFAPDQSLSALDRAAHEAATSPLNDLPHPSGAQKQSGNYKMGRVSVHGLDLSIENPRGSIRSGIGHDGKPWKTQMQDHYGYIRKTVARDGDAVDAFIGPKEETGKVYVVDQIRPDTGKFDEHKVVFGAETPAEARAIYKRNYEPGWRGLGALTEMHVKEFKDWLANGDTRRPVALGRAEPAFGEAVRELIPGAEQAETVPAISQSASQLAMNPGAGYVGFVPDAAGVPGVSVTDKPIRREDILRPLVKALGVPIYQGRIHGKALGTYTVGKETVRLKRANDIEVAAHEFAHLIDDRIPELRQQYTADPLVNQELRAVSYDRTKLHEGFAEFVRLWSTQPEKAKAVAPHAYAWFENFLQDSPYGKPLRDAQQGMTAWFAQDALHRAQSKIGTADSINASLDGLWDKFRQSVSDDLHGIMKMEQELTGKLSPAGAYETARLSRAANSVTEGAVRYGRPTVRPDGSFAFEGHGLEKIIEPVADRLDDWLLYAVGRSADELMRQGRENLFTRAEIDAMLRLKQDGFEKQFMLYQAWNKGILDFAEHMGVINPESRRLWQRNAYLPFNRVGQAGEARSAKPGEWSGVQALTGGTDNIRDVLGNILSNAATLMQKAIVNEARIKVADLADKARGGGKFMTRIAAESRAVKIDAEQVADEVLRKLGVHPRGKLAPAMEALRGEILKAPSFFEFMMGNQTPAGSNVVAVMRRGRKSFYEVGDPILYRAISSLERPDPPWIVKWLAVPKRVGQLTVTLSLDFMVANIARDTMMGAVMSRAGFRPVVDSLKGMISRIATDPDYREFIANGGGLSSYLLDEKRMRSHLERFYTTKGIDYRSVLDAPDKLLYAVETIADAFELSTRLGEFKRAVAAGENPRHAAYLAREVSSDFAMRGDSKALGFLYDTVMFLRPAIISMDRIYRGVIHDPNRAAIAIKSGLIAAMSAGLYLLNRQNPDYADLPDWDKDAHWHFFVGDKHFRWPKIWEVGALASVAERTIEKTIEADPTGLGKDVARILGTTFGVNLMPQIIGPVFEQAANRNSFTGAPIETPGMKNLQPFLRAKPGTSETMKALGMTTRDLPEAVQVNPARAEALLRGYFNSWAMYGLMVTDSMIFGDKIPERRLDQMPVVRRFYEEKPAIRTRYEEMFYDMLGESARLHGTLRALDRMGRPDLADEKEKDPLAGAAKQLERVQQRVHSIDLETLEVRGNQVLSPTEKRMRMDALQEERNNLLKSAVLEVKEATGK